MQNLLEKWQTDLYSKYMDKQAIRDFANELHITAYEFEQ